LVCQIVKELKSMTSNAVGSPSSSTEHQSATTVFQERNVLPYFLGHEKYLYHKFDV
jgi:hypothetical protein